MRVARRHPSGPRSRVRVVRIAGTTPGALTFDRSLIVNLLLFVVVPFASLLTSQAPDLRQVVVDTLRSMLGGLTTG